MTPAEFRREVVADLARFTHDPLGFVLWAWPWGEAGTPLEKEDGPDAWQREQLLEIGRRLKGDPHQVIREAIASGHGIGKSAQVAWIVHWALMTHEDTRGTVTANTDTQLRTKTWPEVQKWFSMLALPPLKELFRVEATSIFCTQPGHEKNWRIDAIPWSERNPEAFAGLHNAGKRTVFIKDEASAIPDIIWEVEEGALTDAETELLSLSYGNPTRNTGRFKRAVNGDLRKLYRSQQIDSRDVKRTNKEFLQELVDTYGENSDFVRVRVKGQFPRASATQFIAEDIAQEARKRDPAYVASQPVIFGLDVARYGDDRSVLAVRQGRDARSIPWKVWEGDEIQRDLMRVAGDIAVYARTYRPGAIFIDKGAMGAGVIDRLMQLNVDNVIPVGFGEKGSSVLWGEGISVETANKRAEMWCAMRAWLEHGGIPDEDDLETDLIGIEYGYAADQVSILLEKKEHMKERGLDSPDKADALALTFAHPVAPNSNNDYANTDEKVSYSSRYDELYER